MALFASGGIKDASAVVGTPTPVDPGKIANDGNLSGVYEIQVTGLNTTEDGSPAGGTDECTDGIDNGPDGLTDAEDPDCHNSAVSLFSCIALQDHQASDNAVKTAVTCYSEASIAGTQAEFKDIDYDGVAPIDETGNFAYAPPPPPPYLILPPSKGTGTYDSGTDTLVTTTCFPNVGGSLGPHIVSRVTFQDPKNVNDRTGVVEIFGQQDFATNCQTLTPVTTGGKAPLILPVDARKVADNRDFDGDGCTDAEELDKDARPKGCGDDPWNPHDSQPGGIGDISGAYDILVVVVPTQWNTATNALTIGAYFGCSADIQHDTGTNDLAARLYCYNDNNFQVVNPEGYAGQFNDGQPGANGRNNPPTNTGPAGEDPVTQCGTRVTTVGPVDNTLDEDADGAVNDGCPAIGPAETGAQCANAIDDDGDGVTNDGCPRVGPATAAESGSGCTDFKDNDFDGTTNDGCPDLYGDVDTKHTELSGSVDKPNNLILLEGCFEDVDGQSPLGHVFTRAKVNVYTGVGVAQIWSSQTLANCTGGTPDDNAGSTGGVATLYVVRQNNALGAQGKAVDIRDDRDSDGDGCPNKSELLDAVDFRDGGGRDPQNPWDYFDVTFDGRVRVADINLVVGKFNTNAGDPDYDKLYDRLKINGADVWNLGPPNDRNRVDDITNVVKQFNHDCGRGKNRLNHP